MTKPDKPGWLGRIMQFSAVVFCISFAFGITLELAGNSVDSQWAFLWMALSGLLLVICIFISRGTGVSPGMLADVEEWYSSLTKKKRIVVLISAGLSSAIPLIGWLFIAPWMVPLVLYLEYNRP